MRKHLLTFIFLVQSLIGFSQFSDEFSDGNLTNNPTWLGNIGSFEVDTTFKLHLNDSIANTSYLTIQSQAIINASWEFEIKLEFDPSTSNYAKVYLVADQEDLTTDLNGYFVKIGGESGTVDDVSLYVQNGNSNTKIIDGTDGLAANSPEFKIKVTRDAIGNWELFLDTSNTYFSEGITFDNNITISNYFGLNCKYTSTRSDKFWFDNFIVTGTEDTTTILQVHQNDIIINEIFADPTPSIGLPEYEYLELYNTTGSAIDLTNWTITIGSTDKIFPSSVIESDSFVILIKEDVFDSFQNNISKIGFSSILDFLLFLNTKGLGTYSFKFLSETSSVEYHLSYQTKYFSGPYLSRA